jgi:hypothetical protein
MTKQFSFDLGQECWLLFRAAADPPGQVWMVSKKIEIKIQIAPTGRVQRDLSGARLVPSRGTGKGKSSLNSFYELVSANGTAASWDNSRSDGRADAVLLCTPTEPGQGHWQSSRKWLAGLQPAIQQTGNPLDRDLVTGSATGYKKKSRRENPPAFV